MEPSLSDITGLGRNVNGRVPSTLLESVPSAHEFDKVRRERDFRFLGLTLFCAVLIGVAFTLFELDSPIVPLLLIGIVAFVVLLWRFPMVSLYTTLVACSALEVFPSPHPDEFTGRVGFWLNLNMILKGQGINASGMPVNPFELVIVTSGLFSLIQAIFGNRVSIRFGTLITPLAFYTGLVVLNYFRGWADGSDYTVMLQEMRCQCYLLITYLLALNTIREKKSVRKFFWIFALCVGLKGILYTYRRYVTLAGMEISDQGVGSHEEAFFFNCFVALLLSLWLCRAQFRLQGWMWILLPMVILGFLATNRRAGTAGFILTVPIILLMAYCTMPSRRKAAAICGLLSVTLGPAYYVTFKNSNSSIAQPARAIRSHFQPDERDRQSNEYRDAENANIMATIKESTLTTLTGYGYGKPFLKVVPMAYIGNIYEFWDIIPHNTVLWVWMRTGLLGLTAFFSVLCYAILGACRTMRNVGRGLDADSQAVIIWGVGVIVAIVVAGFYDLQISNSRNMALVGLVLGLMEGLYLRFAAPSDSPSTSQAIRSAESVHNLDSLPPANPTT